MTQLSLEVYCIDMKYIRNLHKIDFKKIMYDDRLIGVLNFNLMIPVEEKQLQKIDVKIRKHDNDSMNMLESMNTTIEYIEEHLLEELHMPTIVKAAGISESDIQKKFYALTGISIVEYVRRRRLSLAGFELQKGEKSVLEIVLKYGYSSGDMMVADYRCEIWIPVKKE